MTRQRVLAIGVLVLLGASSGLAQERPLKLQGRMIAERLCAQCHAVGTTGASLHTGAPRFRDLDRRVDLDAFPDTLRQGLTSGHPDMPTFRFSRADARALTAYLRSIQRP